MNPTNGLFMVVICLALSVSCAWAQGVNDLSLGVAYADMGDFDSDWGLRAQTWLSDSLLLTGGWTTVDCTVMAEGGPMHVDGQMWQLDLSYVWNMSGWYVGLGGGLRNIDADWTLATLTSDAKKLKAAGHALIGKRWGDMFVDLRYEMGSDLFGYDADGLQATLGMTVDTGKIGAALRGDGEAKPFYFDQFRLPGVSSAAVKPARMNNCGEFDEASNYWDQFRFPKQFP